MTSCEKCATRIPIAGRGRVRRYCSTRCRVAAHRARHALPTELTSRPRWVRHTATKVPLAVDGRAASSTDPRTWTDYATARRSRHGAGLGFVLDGDGVVCIDLDHCLNGDGTVAAWARAILDRCPPTYIEISPSGDGLHIWGTGTVRHGRRLTLTGGTAEIYGTGRYITITGRRHGTSPAMLADLSDVITHLTA